MENFLYVIAFFFLLWLSVECVSSKGFHLQIENVGEKVKKRFTRCQAL